MALEQVSSSFSLASVVEDVLRQQQPNVRSSVGLGSKKADEASLRRYEAASWLRKTIGVVGGKDLPAEPSEEEFRNSLRSGILLCNVLNKIQPGAVPKVVEAPNDSHVIPDGAALSAFQYFENIMNFVAAVEEMGLPAFEACDLEEGAKSARIVDCVLALKSYSEWKQRGGTGSYRYRVNSKPTTFGIAKQGRKNSEPFFNPLARSSSKIETSLDSLSSEQPLSNDLGRDNNEEGTSHSINALVHAVLSDKRQDEIPVIVESMLNKVVEEFEHRLATQSEALKTSSKDTSVLDTGKTLARTASGDVEASCDIKALVQDGGDSPLNDADEEKAPTQSKDEECQMQDCKVDEKSKGYLLKQQVLVEKQQRNIEELKHALHTTKAGLQFLQVKYKEEFNSLGKHLHSLAYAATGYRRVLEENRKLYNQVQDLKGNIRVYCRVRPFLPGQLNVLSTVDHIEEGTITITTPSKYGKEGRKSFTFNKVFGPSATQEEVFSDTQPLIRSVLDGYNICIFAYGQTGSGKTYTMTGPMELTEESLGVNYRALADLFLLSNQRNDTFSYEIAVQMLEIYNEQVRDLLATDGQNKRLEIRNSSQNGINVPDANLVPVSSTSDVLYLMNLGQKNRAVSATAMNDRSSRSHSCLTVHVKGRDLTSGTICRGSMHLVDLAGSERVDKSEVTGDRLKEAQHINKSLAALGDVISSLAQKNSHVPYRNSKLTQLLQDSLGGQAKTLMFVHISPELDAVGETISTLKFAERVGTVELGAARVNKDNTEVKELKEQIANLKAALARKEGETEHVQLPRPITPDRIGRKSLGFSSLHPKFSSMGELSGIHKRQMEDLSGVEVCSDPASSRRHSLDIQELMSSPSWTSPLLDGKDDDRESTSGDWVDKIMVNKREEDSKSEGGNWEVENRQLPEKFYRSQIREPTKIYSEQSSSKFLANNKDKNNQDFEVQRVRYEVANTDESDEAATSDCSETDLMWQLNVQVNMPRVSSIPNGSGSKPKKTQPRIGRPADSRSMIPSLIPPPTRKLPHGVSSHVQRPGKPHADGKKKTGHTK